MALMYKTLCVLVSGYAQAGKTTFSRMLLANMIEHGWNAKIFPLADPVREVATFMGWDGNKDARGRKLLQVIGTDAGRAYNEDVWVSKLIDEILPREVGYPFDSIIIDDWRFPNEKEYIEKNPMYTVYTTRVLRPGTKAGEHLSERALPDIEDWHGYYMSLIHNTGDIYSLQRSAKATFDYLSESYNKGVK